MNEHSKNINGLSLLNIDNSREKRKKIFLRQTGKNLIKNLIDKNNISSEDDTILSFLMPKKIIQKNQRLSKLNQRFASKNNTIQNKDFSFKSYREDYYSEERGSISKLLNMQKLNQLYNNYNLRSKQQNAQKTEIIIKKVRFHDLIERKKNIKRINLKKGIKIKREGYNEFNFYLPIQGILYQKNNNSRNTKNKKFIVDDCGSIKYKMLEMSFNNKKIKFKSSLPLIIKNESQNSLFIRKNKIKKNLFSNPKITIRKKEINLTNIHSYKKLTNLKMISIPGSNNGKIKKNQVSYFIIPKIYNCEEIKIFGIFDGHGENGDILSKEIKEFFNNYFIKLFNNNSEKEDEEYFNDNYIIKSVNKKQDFTSNYNYSNFKLADKENIFNYSEEIKLQNLSDKLKEKSEKINYIYNKLTSDDYSEIFYSHKNLDEILHAKYSKSDLCILSGSTSLILFLFNYKNINKIIASNLGDSKIILISENNTIKELNTVHTLSNQEEKDRIIKYGGVINKLNVGPLRIWFKDKKYPGLSITRSFGDFESDYLGVISIPDVKEYDLDKEKIKILIFGNDGVFKFMKNEQIMNIVLPFYNKDDVEGATQKIKEVANNLWNIKNPKGIADITIFILFFK